MKTFPVLEVFGPTLQGEGMVIGQKTTFVRLAGCDYKCSWCDSAFTWDGSAKDQIQKLSAGEIVSAIQALPSSNHVTISGGNPALYDLTELIDLLHAEGYNIGVETQGSRYQEWFTKIEDLTLSPKPPSSGMATKWEILDDIVNLLSLSGRTPHHATLKVVVFDHRDYDYALQVHERYPHVRMYLQVGNADVKTDDQYELVGDILVSLGRLVDLVMKDPAMNDVRVLPQLHTMLWGNKRGV